jgi:Nuclease A inhibitor-like protein
MEGTMPRITSAPTPKTFAKEWTKEFASAVRNAAGKDGRLSVAEAKKIASQSGAPALFADNALNFLAAKGQKSVDVEKLIASGYNYAYALADKVAGKDGKISQADAKKLPADLQADFAHLRGLDAMEPPKAASAAKVASSMASAMKGLTYMSESDYPFTAISAANPDKKPMSGALVFSQFKGAIEELFKDDVNEVKYKDMAFEGGAKDGLDFITEKTTAEDPSDPDQVKEAKAYQNLLKIVNANLTDVRVVKVGPKDEDGSLASDQGLYGLLIVGRTRDGSLAGLMTGSVET